jgi:hypothetical protein
MHASRMTKPAFIRWEATFLFQWRQTNHNAKQKLKADD